MVWLANGQVIKENLVELVVIVLPRVHQHMVAVRIQQGQHARESNDLWPRANHRHYFELLHGETFIAKVCGVWGSTIVLAHSMTINSSVPVLVMLCVQPGTVSTTRASPPCTTSS